MSLTAAESLEIMQLVTRADNCATAERNPDLAAMYTFLAGTGYGIDVAAVRARYPEVAWSRFADWSAEPQRTTAPFRPRNEEQPVMHTYQSSTHTKR